MELAPALADLRAAATRLALADVEQAAARTARDEALEVARHAHPQPSQRQLADVANVTKITVGRVLRRQAAREENQ